MDWIIVFGIIGLGIACLLNNRAWGRAMHEYYIRESKKHWYGRMFPWEKPWTIVIFRATLIGLGIMLIITAYPLVFGPFYY